MNTPSELDKLLNKLGNIVSLCFVIDANIFTLQTDTTILQNTLKKSWII